MSLDPDADPFDRDVAVAMTWLTVNDPDLAWSLVRRRVPGCISLLCDCPPSFDYPHTKRQHDLESCHGHIHGPNPPCGGCWDCLCQQIAYYHRKVAAA